MTGFHVQIRGFNSSKIASASSTILVLMGLSWIVGGLFSSQQTLGFRDAGHYYYRLYEWQAENLAAGEGILWNPQENLGQPLHGDATASLFYPPKAIVWWGPGSFVFRWNLYLLIHLGWAVAGTLVLARTLRLRPTARWITVLAFVGSGTVLIQLCNVIFLVGAAWLPWALTGGLMWLRSRQWRWCIWGAISLAMMTLGGDPQMAYHVGLLLICRLLFSLVQEDSQDSEAANEQGASNGFWTTIGSCFTTPEGLIRQAYSWLLIRRIELVGLVGMAVLGLLLAWIQISGSWQVAKTSERNLWETPRSIWELAPYSQRSNGRTPYQKVAAMSEGISGKTRTGTHHDFAFQFSVPPWQLAELLWPECLGRVYPIHQRWSQQIPASDRVWLPSLYAGLLPLFLAITAYLGRSTRADFRWIKLWVIWFGVGAFGWYGLGWIGKEVWVGLLNQAESSYRLGSPAGGVYWAMTVALPGYIQFRYPAKLMVVAALGMALLAGYAWDSWEKSGRSKVVGVSCFFTALSMAAWIATWGLRSTWTTWLQSAPPDSVFGPLDVDGAWRVMQAGFLQTTAIAALLTSLLLMGQRRESLRGRWGQLCMVGILVIDLSIAHRALLPMVNQQTWAEPSSLEQAIHQDAIAENSSDIDEPGIEVFRAKMDGWTPRSWWSSSSEERMGEVVKWDRQTLFPKHHLAGQLRMVESPGSLGNRNAWILMQRARQPGVSRQDGVHEPPLFWLAALGTDYIITPSWLPPEWMLESETRLISRDVNSWPEDTLLLKNHRALPDAWFAEQVSFVPFDFGSDVELGWYQAEALLWDPLLGQPRSFQEQVVVHQQQLAEKTSARSMVPAVSPTTTIVADENHRLVLQVATDTAAWLVVPQAFDNGWSASISGNSASASAEFKAETKPIPIHRVNGIMRGLWIEPGEHTVEMTFRPPGWEWHRSVTVIAWCFAFVVATWWGLTLIRRR